MRLETDPLSCHTKTLKQARVIQPATVPLTVNQCPAPQTSCTYAPPAPPPPPEPFVGSNAVETTIPAVGLKAVQVTWQNNGPDTPAPVTLYCVMHNAINQVVDVLSETRTFKSGEATTVAYASSMLPPGNYTAKLFVQDGAGNALSTVVSLPFTI